MAFKVFKLLPFLPLVASAQTLAPLPQPGHLDDKAELGRQLFFDKRLSIDGTVACASCHNLSKGGDDSPSAVSKGVFGRIGSRNAPTVWNASLNNFFFWDGRAKSLEEQAKGPLTNPVEMGNPDMASLVARLNGMKAYPGITEEKLLSAIAAFERTLITPNSRLDKYLNGNNGALNAQEKRGLMTFTQVGCIECHNGALLADTKDFERFPRFAGSIYETKYALTLDKGRYNVTHNEKDMHRYKVPTLRNVALTAPYFHNGSVKTLDEAVRVMGKTQLNADLSEEEVKDIVAFLKTATGEFNRKGLRFNPAKLISPKAY
jgi:cytochrome c peroxidase